MMKRKHFVMKLQNSAENGEDTSPTESKPTSQWHRGGQKPALPHRTRRSGLVLMGKPSPRSSLCSGCQNLP